MARTMLRKTLTILSLVGLLLSLGLWGVSYLNLVYSRRTAPPAVGFPTTVTFPPPFSISPTGVLLSEGQPLYEYSGYFLAHGGLGTWSYLGKIGRAPKPGWRRTTISRRTVWLPKSAGGIVVPLWIPTVLFTLILWASSVPLHRRRKRKRLGLCVKCGYNLTGLTEPRCPECGQEFETCLES